MAFYISKTKIARREGGVREARIPVDAPVLFGYHSEVADHYQRAPGSFEPHATTLDYIVAATGG